MTMLLITLSGLLLTDTRNEVDIQARSLIRCPGNRKNPNREDSFVVRKGDKIVIPCSVHRLYNPTTRKDSSSSFASQVRMCNDVTRI